MQKDIDYIPQDDEIEELRQRILAAKDTEEESLRHANEELMTHFIYNSVNIAGDRVSRVNTMRTLKNIDSLADPTLKVALEILGLRDAYNKMLTIAEQSAIQTPAYRRYIYMHPFKGGNGHLARLILALTMHKYRYPAIVIPNKWKAEYDSLIKNYDEDAFADFLRKCCLTTLNITVSNLGTTYSERKTRHIRGITPETEILEHIRQNPGIKSIDMKKYFPKISYTKMTRIIRALREEGKIIFKGATKSGGYYAGE